MIREKTNFLKIILIITLCIMILISIYLFALNIPLVYAMELDGDEYDEVFLENIQVLAKDYYGTDISISAEKELLYDLQLNKFGYIYDFTINAEKGFAIVINTIGKFEISEAFFNAKNPYANNGESTRIYVGNMIYLYYNDYNFYFATNDIKVNNGDLNNIANIALYSGYDDLSSETQPIYFTSKTESAYQLAKKHPYITDSPSFSNECSVIAGANIIQYWDRYKTNLIPNYAPGKSLSSYFLYSGESDTTDKLIQDLYYDMGTNTNGYGTTINQFLNGLVKYNNRNGGYSITYNSCMSAGKFNYNIAKQFIDNQQPIVLFLSSFNIVIINNKENNDNLSITLSQFNHTISAFGYKDITYKLTNGTNRNDKYLAIATGMRELPTGYFNIAYKTNIDNALAININ